VLVGAIREEDARVESPWILHVSPDVTFFHQILFDDEIA
jgi:hypothetical protein